jgi:hypothetical protein
MYEQLTVCACLLGFAWALADESDAETQKRREEIRWMNGRPVELAVTVCIELAGCTRSRPVVDRACGTRIRVAEGRNRSLRLCVSASQ